MRYMWKFFLLLMLVVTSCSEKQIDGNVINVAEAMSRLSEGQSVQNLFSSISYIPLETNEQAIIGKYPECIIMDSAILVSSVHQNLKLFDRTNGKYIRDIGHVGTDPEGYAKDSWGKVSFWADAVRRTVYLLGWNNDFLLYGFDGKYKDRIRLQDTVNCILSQNYYLMDADRIWGHNKMKLSPETPSVFYMDRNTMSLTGIATWNSALLPMDEVLSVSNLLGGNVAYGGDLAMAEFVGDRKYYTAINSPSLWKSKDAIRVKQAFNDTIYTISEQGLTPYLVFELGEWHWSEQQQTTEVGSPTLEVDALSLNPGRQEANFDGQTLELTGTEFTLLYLLAQHLGQVVSREHLSQEVLGKRLTPFDRAIDMHISNLRRKLPERKDGHPWFKTLRGRGYLMVSAS